jgi:hypothetical protein
MKYGLSLPRARASNPPASNDRHAEAKGRLGSLLLVGASEIHLGSSSGAANRCHISCNHLEIVRLGSNHLNG